jgi:hypothetical protein
MEGCAFFVAPAGKLQPSSNMPNALCLQEARVDGKKYKRFIIACNNHLIRYAGPGAQVLT